MILSEFPIISLIYYSDSERLFPLFFLNTSGLSPIDVQIYLKKSIVGPLSRRVHTVYIKIYLHVDKF